MILLDTHAWAWPITNDRRLSAQASLAMSQSANTFVSPAGLFEIGLKVRAGKWPEMVQATNDLLTWIKLQNAQAADLTPEVCLLAAQFDWPHRDPFGRMIAATAIHFGRVLVFADVAFDKIVARIW